ncbi:tetratricopeptide repeat protein [Embleya sp. NBC_00896]|uniref:tetratricopeptide repeat protein n=1 Tax=Embleya sp. NBC_00896 TaxID=2975961 RepID=UPI0038658B82|nr:tetratricopeptide repeat protein [Embleya sp. NBC_00896]
MRTPVDALPAIVDQLPPGGLDFVGRADELDTLYTWVTGPGAAIPAQLAPNDPEHPGTTRTVWLPRDRVVAITGPVGVGRTEFAVRLAHRLAPHFPDGRLYARLTGPRGELIPPGDVLESLLYALGTATIPSAHEERIRLFREHLDGKRFLLLLEDVTGTAQLRPLLPQSPTALVVITSVSPLTGLGRAAAVRTCALDMLDVRASAELLGNLAGHTRVACDPRAADELAALCDFHPAALRMAGAWLRARPRYAMADVGRRLRAERLRLHEQAGDDLAVRACFSLIHRELVPSAARLLRLLALVPGREFGADAAAALADCGPDAATRSLTELRELHLLEQGSVPGRFRFHDLVRGYVQERLDAEERPGERRNARVRLLDRYVRLARSAERIIVGTDGPDPGADVRFESADEARAWLRDERPELLAAARVAAAAGLDAATRRLVAVLTRLLDRRAHWSDVRELHELALTTARRAGSGRQEAVALLNLGNLHVARDELEEALSCYRAALEVSRGLGDPAGEGRAMVNLGNAYADLGDLQRAADWYDRSLLLRRTIGDAAGQARVLSHLGRLHARMGRFEQSVRDHRAALGVRRRIGDPADIGRVLTDIAAVLGEAGRTHEALAVYRDAMEAFRAAGDERLEALALLQSAELVLDAGDVRDARSRRREALALLVDAGAPEAAEVRRYLGDE